MEKLEITGDKKLQGSINISGSKNASLPIMLGAIFIISFAMGTTSNATENPFGSTLLNTGYVVADGHKHTEQSNQKQKECNPDKGQNCNPPAW